MLPFRARVDLGAMAMKKCSAFPNCLVSYQGTRWGNVLPLCREAVGVFYSPSRLGRQYDDEVPVMVELLGNAEHLFIAIVPRSTLVLSGST